MGFQPDFIKPKDIQIQENTSRKKIQIVDDKTCKTSLIGTELNAKEGVVLANIKQNIEELPMCNHKQASLYAKDTKNIFDNVDNQACKTSFIETEFKEEKDLVLANIEQNIEQLPVYNHNNTIKLFDNQGEKELTILDALIRNSLTKKREGLFLCNFCKEEFIYMTLMRIHMEAHFEGFPGKYKPAMVKIQGAKNWKCLECGKISPKNHMRKHIEVHVPGLQYKCPDCSVTLKSKNNLRSHLIKKKCKPLHNGIWINP